MFEKSIRAGLEAALKDYEDRWRVSVLGSAGRDLSEIRVQQREGVEHSVKRLKANERVERSLRKRRRW
jgi:hypothetical protein